jgi:hypothetical protein
MKNISKDIFYWILIIACLLFLIRKCESEKSLIKDVQTINSYQDTVKTYKAKNGKLVEYNSQLQVSLQSLELTKDS